jgi:hypothetical protein
MMTRTSLHLMTILASVLSGVASTSPAAHGQHPFGQLNPNAPPETAQWGQLAGAWDCTIPSTAADGTVREGKATWTWSYIIDGYAVQDIYVGHRTDGRADFYGTGVRTYHPELKKWEIMWTANTTPEGETSKMTLFEATYQNEQIVMKYVEGDPEWRVVFFDITDDSFEWMNEPSGQRMRCERVDGSQR